MYYFLPSWKNGLLNSKARLCRGISGCYLENLLALLDFQWIISYNHFDGFYEEQLYCETAAKTMERESL